MFLAVIIFIIGYIFIALENPIKIDKSATALLLASAIWAFYIFVGEDIFAFTGYTENFAQFQIAHPEKNFIDFVSKQELLWHIGDIAEILFFLLCAMIIVETIDYYDGFSIITDKITTDNKRKLLWILTTTTFILSAILDNLTVTIVMCTLLRKLVDKKKYRWFFAGWIVLAANIGGAWSPIGDVTTIMLWMNGQVTAPVLILKTIIPCIVALLVPLVIVSFTIKGNFETPNNTVDNTIHKPSARIRNFIFSLGIGGLLFVPVFKTITHLPPFIGMLFSLSVLWLVTARLHQKYFKRTFSCAKILEKIGTSTILFFLGILLAVAGLQSMGYLSMLATGLSQAFNNDVYSLDICIGVISSIVDNVPLVAGTMGMFPLSLFPTDHDFWIFLSYCVGAGGNILVVGSAAGVAAMGLEKIDFIWYLKNITIWALIGFFAGVGTFILLNKFVY